MSGMHLSKEFFELLKAIGESKSKQEEDRIITREVQTLKKKLESVKKKSGPPASYGGSAGASSSGQNALATNKKKAKEFLVRLLYVEMLGHDGSFGYIKALELAASSSIVMKRTGYLVSGACLPPEHEFRFMLVNQMQRDLNSSHVLEVCAALLAVTAIITGDMVPAISNEVAKLLAHASETVRKKAIIAMHRFHQIAPEVVTRPDLVDKLRRILCDRDPGVMGSSLNVIDALANVDAKQFKDLVPSLVSILKQICEHRLPSDFDYHRVPAPWMQMKIVRILATLGRNDAAASNGMYEILSDCMKKADVGINAGYAVVYECVRTITAIYPNPTLLDAAADAISRFISSRSHNLKYLGVTGLAGIVESHPQYAAAHQLVVIECLEDRDETLQRRTLDLLYKMTNPVNVEFITEKLLHFLRGTTDVYLRKNLTAKICRIAERYAPSNTWYVQTITELFEISGDLVKSDVAQNLMSLIAEGTGGGGEDGNDEEADMLLRQHAVEIYAALLDRPHAKLPKLLIETMAWVLGEYAYLSAEFSLETVLEKLCVLVRKGKKFAPSTRKIIVSSIMKLVAQAGTCPPQAAKVIDDFARSKDMDLQQRCLEFQNLLTSAPQILGEVLPVDASCEDVDVDVNLSFLDAYVKDAVLSGAQEYSKPEDDDDDDSDVFGSALTAKASAFKMTPYEKPNKPTCAFGAMRGVGSHTSSSAPGVSLPPGGGGYGGGPADALGGATPSVSIPTISSVDPIASEPQLKLHNVATVWGKGGLSQPPAVSHIVNSFTSTPPPAPVPTSIWSHQTTPQPPSEPVKSAEQLRKEQMAAGLFGGTGPGAPPPALARPAVPKRIALPAVASPAPVNAPPAPVAAPPAPDPPESVFDLLDFVTSPSEPLPAPVASFDMMILNPSPVEAPALSAPAPFAPAPPPPVDPFAGAGLLDGFKDMPLASLSTTDSKFEHGGNKMAPLPITTAKFGQQWGSCSANASLNETTTKIITLDDFMSLCETIGAHKVEAIVATNEGIAAGMIGGSIMVLLHGKITPLGVTESKVNVTIKSTDGTVCSTLAMFLQTFLR